MAVLKATGDTAARARSYPAPICEGQRDGGLRDVLGDPRRRCDRGGERLTAREEGEAAATTKDGEQV